jgi:Zinc finger, C3HC4 type (RING finger)
MSAESVELICVKEGKKLRVRVISDGYYKDANCQFPRALRAEGRRFRVPPSCIKIMNQRGKYFYSIRAKNMIEIVEEKIDIEKLMKSLSLYEDENTDECIVCMEKKKDRIFYPCGHYYCCEECSKKLVTCPICRRKIETKIDKALMTE